MSARCNATDQASPSHVREARGSRAIAGIFAFALALTAAHADPPEDLAWLRGKVGDGALCYESGGKIYLVELKDNKVVQVGSGNACEFSPDGYKLAWIDGSSVRGVLRSSLQDVRTLATGVSKASGVHWIGANEFVAVKSGKWFRIPISGTAAEVPELTKLGAGSVEVDVKRGSDGVWSFVDGMKWKTSDGKSGTINGHCSGSLSPDGKSATGLQNGHTTCNLTSVRSGGKSGSFKWNYGSCGSKGFDNQRYSSNQSDLVVVQYECKNWIAVVDINTNKGTRMGGGVSGEAYGDFVKGSPGGSWPGAAVEDKLTLDAESLDFVAVEGGANPAAKILKASGGSAAPSGLQIEGAGQWLTVNVGSASGVAVPVTHTVSLAGLAPGPYAKTLTVKTTNLGTATYKVNLVVAKDVPAFQILAPNGGETYKIGDKVEIRWSAQKDKVSGADLHLSIGGTEWLPLSNKSIFPEDAAWGRWSWTIPETLQGKSLVGDRAKIRIVDYNDNTMNDASDNVFKIAARSSSTALWPHRQGFDRSGSDAKEIPVFGFDGRRSLIPLDRDKQANGIHAPWLQESRPGIWELGLPMGTGDSE